MVSTRTRKVKEPSKVGKEDNGVDLLSLVNQSKRNVEKSLTKSKSNGSGSGSGSGSGGASSRKDDNVLSLKTETNFVDIFPTSLSSEIKQDSLYLNFDVEKGVNNSKNNKSSAGSGSGSNDKNNNTLDEEDSKSVESKINKLRKDKLNKKSESEKWLEFVSPELTQEIETDLKILKMRHVLDRKRHYKGNDTNKIPTKFQIGTVIAGPTDYFSQRLTKKERKHTIVDELLNDDSAKSYYKRKFREVQQRSLKDNRLRTKAMSKKSKRDRRG